MASAAQRRIKAISYAKYGYMFIAPFFLVYFFFQLWPLINTFILSFQANKTGEFVGFDNYKTILFAIGNRTAKNVSKNFFSAFGNTIILWVGNFIPQIALSLSLAVWFTDANLKIPGTGFFKVVMYLPNIITAASVAVLFLQLCGEAENAPGAINLLLAKKDDASQKYDTIKFITGVWQSRGVVMFIQTW
ncbi:MAG: sugar ABC transporter permease, partial [Ruminococcus sp.]|nr:sugar ABC transporter permease [Ruminococcus sp.]